MRSRFQQLGRDARHRRLTHWLRVIEDRYAKELEGLLVQLGSEYARAVPRMLGREDGWFEDVISFIERAFAALLARFVGRAFDKMAKGVVRNITEHDTGIQPAIAAAREENIRLIEKTSLHLANDVREVFSDPLAFGLRVEEIQKRILERAAISTRHAALIARDQTLKLNAAITRIRMQNAGVERYEWVTSRDERVRLTHRELDGRVFSWMEGTPIGYHPGEDYQCRCVAVAVFDDGEANEQFPGEPDEEG